MKDYAKSIFFGVAAGVAFIPLVPLVVQTSSAMAASSEPVVLLQYGAAITVGLGAFFGTAARLSTPNLNPKPYLAAYTAPVGVMAGLALCAAFLPN